MNTILLIANHFNTIYKFRRELVERLLENEFRVVLAYPKGDDNRYFSEMGCEVIDTILDRHGTNPVRDLRLYRFYVKLIKQIKPCVVLTYTIKPNIYGGLACRKLKVPCLANITGIGAIGGDSFLHKFVFLMQKRALAKNKRVFFQNQKDMNIYIKNKIATGQALLLPGSGVNLNNFYPVDYPTDDSIVKFIIISRIREDKGIEEMFELIKRMKGSCVEFHVFGSCENDGYMSQMEEIMKEHPLFYHGVVPQDELRDRIADFHCLIHPSHSEGMANAILECAAKACPAIASDIPGCREGIDDTITGYLYPCGDVERLFDQVVRFINLTWEQKRDMGLKGRKKVEQEFDREIVIGIYMKEIEEAFTRSNECNE